MSLMKKSILYALIAPALISQAYAIDVNAGDYTTLPSGTNVGVLYYQHSQMDGYYQNGEKAEAESTSNIGLARLIHYTDIFGVRATPQIILPFGSVNNTEIAGTKLNNVSGFADPIVATAFWLVNQPEQGASGRYVALTPFLYIPIGQYDAHQAVNLGENRFKADLQFAWVQPLYNKFSFEFYQDLIWYGDNDKAGTGNQTLSQDVSYQTQVNLRYDLNPSQRWAVGYAANYAGDQSLDGVDLQQDVGKQQLRLEYQQMVNPKTQLSAQLVSDTHAESGFKKELGLNFRLFYIF